MIQEKVEMLEYENCPSCGAPVKFSLMCCEYCAREFKEMPTGGNMIAVDAKPDERLSDLFSLMQTIAGGHPVIVGRPGFLKSFALGSMGAVSPLLPRV